MARSTASVLLALDGGLSDELADPGRFSEALSHHVSHVREGIRSLIVQIGTQQHAYIQSQGCPGCHHDRCRRGCRMQLLRRILAIGLPSVTPRVVPLGLHPRPYVRHYLLLPTQRARMLEATMLRPWTDARLALDMHRGRRTVSIVGTLSVGDGPDARPYLRSFGWRAIAVPKLVLERLIGLAHARQRTVHQPLMLLLPQAHNGTTSTEEIAGDLDGKALHVAATTAAIVAEQIHHLGARLECLDVDADLRTTRILAVASTTDDAPAQLIDVLRDQQVLLVQRDDPLTVVVSPSYVRSAPQRIPMLRIGDRPTGSSRWRPLSSVHHVGIVGPVQGEMLAGMLVPVIASHPDVRIGVLDLADGRIAHSLAGLPQRIPTENSEDLAELLGGIGRLDATRTCVIAIVVADRAAAALAAVTALLRMGVYREVSLVLVLPILEELPSLLRDRLPLVLVRQQGAEWQTRSGQWRWAMPTALRLPWRDPTMSWRDITGTQPAVDVPHQAGFWALPAQLEGIIGDSIPVTPVDMTRADDEGPVGSLVGDEGAAGVDTMHNVANDDPLLHAGPVIDAALLLRVVAWAETHGGQSDGISIRRLHTERVVADKDTAAAVIATLRDHDLLLDETRKGWFRVRSLADAQRHGLLATDGVVDGRNLTPVTVSVESERDA